jgi:hypothetical protein
MKRSRTAPGSSPPSHGRRDEAETTRERRNKAATARRRKREAAAWPSGSKSAAASFKYAAIVTRKQLIVLSY